MGGGGRCEGSAHHPDERAIYYDNEKHNKRKVGDFSKLLHGLKAAAGIPELFENISIQSPLVSDVFSQYNLKYLTFINCCPIRSTHVADEDCPNYRRWRLFSTGFE
jgi:hypothetical protein